MYLQQVWLCKVMKAIWCFLFILLSTLAAATAVCPPWFIPDNRSSTGCSCQGSPTAAKCGENSPLLHFGYCATYDSTSEKTNHGPCPYIAHYNTTAIDDVFYIQLPENASLLNEFMCGPLNREGTLCGKCKDGYGIALYSYTLECSKCWGHGYGWVLYYFLELFPITVMYILVVIFHIRATSSPLSALVFMSQIVVYTIRLNVSLHMYIENEVTGFPYVALHILLLLCGIWSLDVFSFIVPPFCVSSNIKTVHALALEYIVAFYPICLILITYVCIKLHDNNFRVIVWLWKPFHRHFAYFRRRWDSKASIINAFTTFLLLSFSKILFVSFTLLYTIGIDQEPTSDGAKIKHVLYYDPSVKIYTPEFYMFAALAGCVLVLFVFFPTILLILYPTRLFRKCVSCCGFRRWHALHMFVESFQGQYKDGTNGTRDFRMASASFLILRFLYIALFLNRIPSPWQLSEVKCVLFICASYLHAITRPYKLNYMNNVDVSILILLALMSVTILAATVHPATYTIKLSFMISTLLLCVPHMVLIFYISYGLAKKAGVNQCLQMKYQALRTYFPATRCTRQAVSDVEVESVISSLPDRLIHPEEYEPMSATAEEHRAAKPTENEQSEVSEPRRLTPIYTYGSFN